MKIAISLFATLPLVLAFAACGPRGTTTNSSDDTEADDAGDAPPQKPMDAGVDAHPDAAVDAADAASACAPDTLTCATANMGGKLAGDEQSPPLVVKGTGPDWVKFQVTENDGSWSAKPMHLTAILDPPSAYEMRVFLEAPNAAPTCASPVNDSPNDFSAEWGETIQSVAYPFANDTDDGRLLVIQIFPTPGSTCKVPWKLTIQGGAP